MRHKKKKHHYVWQNYLQAWAENNQIYCLRDNKIFLTNLVNIAQERFFYKIFELNEYELFLIRELMKPVNPQLMRGVETQIDLLQAPFKAKRKLISLGFDKDIVEKEFSLIEANYEEDLHGLIEGKVIEVIEQLRNCDVKLLEVGELKVHLLHFLASQYFRTKKIRDSFNRNVEQNFKLKNVDFSKIQKVLCHVFAYTVGATLYSENDTGIFLIKNSTAIPFITGDQPVVNTFATGNEGKDIQDLEFYYPISPAVAVIVSRKKNYMGSVIEVLDTDRIKAWNKHIFLQSNEQLYSREKSLLEEFKK